MNKQSTGYVALMFILSLASFTAWGDYAIAGESFNAPVVACQEYWTVQYRSSGEIIANASVQISGSGSNNNSRNLGCKGTYSISTVNNKWEWRGEHSEVCKQLSKDKDFIAIIKKSRMLAIQLSEMATIINDLGEEAVQSQKSAARQERIRRAGIRDSNEKEEEVATPEKIDASPLPMTSPIISPPDRVKIERKEIKKSGIRIPDSDGKLVDKAELDEEYGD